MIRLLKDLPESELVGKRVLLRADFNVPIKSDQVSGDYRLRRSLPTIEFLRERGAKIIIMSHLGDKTASLSPVVSFLSEILPVSLVTFDEMMKGKDFDNEILVLENLRQLPGEEANDDKLAGQIASWGDIYVNDAFSASHRSHASIVSLPKYLPSYAGLLLADEYEHLNKILEPEKPLILILGGAKFSTKLPLVEKYLSVAEQIFVVGALAHPLFSLQGYEIGKSLMDDEDMRLSTLINNSKIVVPEDVVVQGEDGQVIKTLAEIKPDDIIYDAGPQTVEKISSVLPGAKTILWNGPLGHFENGYDQATRQIALAVASSEAYSVVGGGDTVSAIESLNLADDFGFVSTAGGAMLEYLATGTLPGLEVLMTD